MKCYKSFQSFLEAGGVVSGVKSESGNEELLGGIIYYLQQIVGRRKYEVDVLTSVVSSLCLLLFPHSISSHTDTDTGNINL